MSGKLLRETAGVRGILAKLRLKSILAEGGQGDDTSAGRWWRMRTLRGFRY